MDELFPEDGQVYIAITARAALKERRTWQTFRRRLHDQYIIYNDRDASPFIIASPVFIDPTPRANGIHATIYHPLVSQAESRYLRYNGVLFPIESFMYILAETISHPIEIVSMIFSFEPSRGKLLELTGFTLGIRNTERRVSGSEALIHKSLARLSQEHFDNSPAEASAYVPYDAPGLPDPVRTKAFDWKRSYLKRLSCAGSTYVVVTIGETCSVYKREKEAFQLLSGNLPPDQNAAAAHISLDAGSDQIVELTSLPRVTQSA